MKRPTAAAVIAFLSLLALACCNSPGGKPSDIARNEAQENGQPAKCMEFHSKWRGRGTVRELSMLKDMNDEEIREFLQDYHAEP